LFDTLYLFSAAKIILETYGCSFIDLDTPLLLSEDPVYGGYEAFGPLYKFTNARGHGGFLHLDNNGSK
jgi:hypothetical protein